MPGASDDEEAPRVWAPLEPESVAAPASAAEGALSYEAGGWPPAPTPAAPVAAVPDGYGPPPLPGGYGEPKPKAGTARTGPLPLHPMSVGDVLDGAFKVFKAEARTMVLVVAAIVVPVQFVSAFLVREQLAPGLLNVLRDPTLVESTETFDLGSSAGSMASFLLSVVALPFIAGAVSRVVAGSYLGSRISPGAALAIAVRRFPALLGSFLLVHLAEAVGFVMCVLPGLVLMALFTAVAPAIAIEELGPIQGMRRSWRLMRPRLWPVLGISLLAGFIASTLGNLLGVVPTVAVTLLGGNLAWLVLAGVGVLTQVVTAPLVAIVATLIYFDGRIRHEGFDLQVMAGDLERSARR